MIDTGFRSRLEAAFRAIDRRRWRRRGEQILKVRPGRLDRINYDALQHDVLCVVEDAVAQAMRAKAASLRAQADAVERAACDFEGKSAVRRFDVKTANLKSMNEIADAFANDWCEKNVIGWKKREAA